MRTLDTNAVGLPQLAEAIQAHPAACASQLLSHRGRVLRLIDADVGLRALALELQVESEV